MLDVVIRAGILELLDSLRREGLGVIYVTHDIATARQFGDDVMVMHGGRVIERGPREDVIKNPVHPYTMLLVEAAPDPARHSAREEPRRGWRSKRRGRAHRTGDPGAKESILRAGTVAFSGGRAPTHRIYASRNDHPWSTWAAVIPHLVGSKRQLRQKMTISPKQRLTPRRHPNNTERKEQ